MTPKQVMASAEARGLPRREAELLLQYAADRDRVWLIAHGTDPLDTAVLDRYQHYVDRRLQGEPIAYIAGCREFWSLSLEVSPAVLIPRPDTEILVQWAHALVSQHRLHSALDLGTGSGAIALALKTACPELHVTAADYSEGALAVAEGNGSRLGLSVNWVLSDWFSAFAGRRWPLIVSNPPYIAEDDPHLNQGDLRAEPRTALASGGDGLNAIRAIIASAGAHLEPRGWLVFEHGWDQGSSVRKLLQASGFEAIETRLDLAGHERVTGARYGGADSGVDSGADIGADSGAIGQ